MNFRSVFIAIVIATGLIVAAYLVNSKRPRIVVEQPNAAFVRASGKCAECHRNNQYSIVHEYEMSKHAAERRHVPGLPSGGHRPDQHEPQRLCHQHRRHPGQLPHLPRGRLRPVRPQPPCRAVMGGGHGQQGFFTGHDRADGKAPSRLDEASAASAGEIGRRCRRQRAAASRAIPSANRTPTAPSATARSATRGTRRRWKSRACPAPAASAISARIIRKWKSTRNPSTASCSPRSATC